MRKFFTILATVGILATSSAYAECPTQEEFNQHMDAYLNQIHDRLGVTSEEDTSWNEFKQAWMSSIPPMKCRLPPVKTIPERVERDEYYSSTYTKRVNTIKQPLMNFYNSLHDDQKKAFDLIRIKGLTPPD